MSPTCPSLLCAATTMTFNSAFRRKLQGARVRSRGYLPHIEVDDSYYSIGYHLADALPVPVLTRLREDRSRLLSADGLTAVERSLRLEEFQRRYDTYLDAGNGSCVLAHDDVAAIVAENLRHHDGKLYHLDRWCVMPNHVHALIYLLHGDRLDDVLHSWKSYTATKINSLLGARGALWQREYFDRVIRDERDLANTREYIWNNPAALGLSDWRWRGSGK